MKSFTLAFTVLQAIFSLSFWQTEALSPNKSSARRYELDLRLNKIFLTSSKCSQLARLNKELFVIENDTCKSVETNNSFPCKCYEGGGDWKWLAIDLEEIGDLEQLSLHCQVQRTFDELILNSALIKPLNKAMPLQRISMEIADQVTVCLHLTTSTETFPEVTLLHNEIPIFVNSSETKKVDDCWINKELHETGTLAFTTKMSGTVSDNFVLTMNGTTLFAVKTLLQDDPKTNLTESPESTPSPEVNSTRSEEELREEAIFNSVFGSEFCHWQAASEETTVTLFLGPCWKVFQVFPVDENSTEMIVVSPTPETLAYNRFMHHNFDKLERQNETVFYWIIDLSNFSITEFICFKENDIICGTDNASKPCHFIYTENMAIFVLKINSHAAGAVCFLNDKYVSMKDSGGNEAIYQENIVLIIQRSHKPGSFAADIPFIDIWEEM